MIVPVMLGWNAHLNGKVPAAVSVISPVCPLFRRPVSKLPSSAVSVCGAPSLLVTVIVSPTAAVSSAGEKAKPSIVTAWVAACDRPAISAKGVARSAASVVRRVRVVGQEGGEETERRGKKY